MNNCIKLY